MNEMTNKNNRPLGLIETNHLMTENTSMIMVDLGVNIMNKLVERTVRDVPSYNFGELISASIIRELNSIGEKK